VRRQRQEQVTAEDGSVDLDQNLVGVLDDEDEDDDEAKAISCGVKTNTQL